VDGSDNVVLTTRFGSTADFGGTNLTSAGSIDIAVAKLSSTNGATMWAKSFGGPNPDVPAAIVVDGFGDVIVTGNVGLNANLGRGSISSDGIFMAKYSGLNGTNKWAKVLGGGSSGGYGIATDPNTGNIIVTGAFLGSVNFGGGSVSSGP